MSLTLFIHRGNDALSAPLTIVIRNTNIYKLFHGSS